VRRFIDPSINEPVGSYVSRLIDHVRTPLYGGAYALILSSGSTSALGMVYWTLAARLYLPSVVGVNAAVISSMTFLSYLAQLNMSGALSRFTPTAGRATRRLIASAYLSAGALSAAAALIFLVGIQRWAPEASGLVAGGPIAVWFVVGTVAWSIFALQDGALTGLRQTIWVPISNTVFAVAKIVLLALFATGTIGFGIFASWTIPAALLIVPVNLLIFLRFVPRHVAARSARMMEAGTRQIVRYLVGDYVGSLLVNASVSLLPLIVLATLGAEASAYFYIGWTIAYSLQLMSLNIATSLMVEGAARRETLDIDSRRSLVLLIRIQVPLVIGVFVFAGFILRLFGEQYQDESEGLLRVLTLAVLPHGVNAIFLSVARVRRQVGRIVVIQGALAGLSLSLSWVLLGPLGILGVGIAWLLAQSLVALVLLVTGLTPMWRSHTVAGLAPGYPRTSLADVVPRAAPDLSERSAASGRAVAAEMSALAPLFASLEGKRIEWSLLREAQPVPGDDVDLLVNPDDLPALRSLLRGRGFVEVVSRGRGSHRFFTALDGETGRFIELDVVTELSFGRFFELPTGLAGDALSRRRRRGLGVALDPDDAFWSLLFHCLVDKQTISPVRGSALRELATQASADGPFGRLAGALLPSPWDPSGVLDAVRRGDLDEIAEIGPSVASRWRRRAPVATAWRWASGAFGRALEPLAKIRRGGMTVALLGLDGAGKSTLAERLATSYGTPTRSVYMGLWKRGDGPARRRFGAIEIVLRPARIWARYLLGQIYRASGNLVIFDRYTYDAAIPPSGGHLRLKRAYFWLLAHSVPAPDLTILLDAPIDVLDARKPEAAGDDRSPAATALREVIGRHPNGVIVDASRSSDAVLADVTAMIWQHQVFRWGTVAVDRGSGLVRRFDTSILAPVAGGRRRMISARASRTPKDLQAVVSELRQQGVLDRETVRDMIVTDTGVRVAWMWTGIDSPSLVLKVGQRGHDDALLAHVAAVERLRSDQRLVDLDAALPRIRSFGRLDDVAYVVEEPLSGVRGDRLIRDRRVRSGLLVAAAEWIGTLHRQTGERREVDEGLIEAWIDRPAAAIAELLVPRAGARRRVRALARLAASLREDLTGQPVDVGWVHGDYWAGNLLATPDGTRVLGVVDWDLAGRPELPLHDILHLILYARRLNGDLELGEIVASALDRPDWDVTERLILERCSLGWPVDPDGARRAIALSWLRHVGAFAGDGSHGANRIWLRRNVDPVLDR
jgi:O-antigen/teichoic acid export membrane protein/thymidylate kinase